MTLTARNPGDQDPETDAVLDALASAFTGPDGRPVPVERRLLSADRIAGLRGDGDGVLVVDDAALAAQFPGATAALVVLDREHQRGTALITHDPVGRTHVVAAEAVGAATGGLRRAVAALTAEAAVIDALQSVGRQLTAQLDIDTLVQDATDAATTAVGAAFGAFFYNLINQFGESYTLYTLSGVPREAFSRFPMPRNTEVFAPTFDGTGTLRSDDITADRRFGHNAPYHGMPEGHLPVRSYLAVSVISPSNGEVLGGFFFGHPERSRFTARHEGLAEGIAGYSAIALDNARLYERERNFTRELSRNMLPEAPPVPGLDLVTRYLPAARGPNIGGDWFDVIRLDGGATAFVIGDVVGHGVPAATIMGQVRTAVRSYALLGLAPSEVLRRVAALLDGFIDSTFVTCFYAVHAPGDELVFANAGHLPALLRHADGTTEQLGDAIAQPLGVGTEFPERTAAFPPGTDLLLYTDGLVESRSRDVTQGMEWLRTAFADLPRPLTSDACDGLVAALTGASTTTMSRSSTCTARAGGRRETRAEGDRLPRRDVGDGGAADRPAPGPGAVGRRHPALAGSAGGRRARGLRGHGQRRRARLPRWGRRTAGGHRALRGRRADGDRRGPGPVEDAGPDRDDARARPDDDRRPVRRQRDPAPRGRHDGHDAFRARVVVTGR
ncbi:GAF domain-containing protein [Actinomycetospora succinea]|uniref:GAF domain-containing protein n=1 Tax=Actinomycetospora succinea TaxID=663603 RepID=A0A4R6VDP8_9PSEU|nr:GAF domain-containing SpoIIE family protein phosphatase [Actinomycetospora succinea]TDQ58864.1 GAF domain-containing protein [Actinomycetospora succinea]